MDTDAKKTALRMIPYGIYVLTADDAKGNVGAATVNWVTQGSFTPPLVVVGVKADSGAHTVVKGTGRFALNMLGKEHKGRARSRTASCRARPSTSVPTVPRS
ncbi:MAG TPA: flavin reductase family protein [Rhodopila sp.]